MSQSTRAQLQRMNTVKRAIDLTLILLAAPLLLPLGLVTSVIVRITMGGPVLFTQERIGLGEKPFRLFKFRTMTDRRGPDGELLPDRERMTRVGTLLRKLSLDEIPQFLNVARGDMAIIGPRPLYVAYLPYYRGEERDRHLVRPGITGLAQVSGRNGLYWKQRLALDAEYVRTIGLRTDWTIFLRTIERVLNSSGVVTIANDSGERLDTLRSYPSERGYAIRRLEYSDVPFRVRLFNDERVREHMQLPENVTEAGTRDWLKAARVDPAKRDFTVYEEETERPVGLLGLRERVEARVPEMYILVDPSEQGKGLGSLSLRLLLDWMKRQPDYSGCWLTVSAGNEPAVALYQRAGFEVVKAPGDEDNRFEMVLYWHSPGEA